MDVKPLVAKIPLPSFGEMYLLRCLIGRDIKIKYQRSVLGLAWSMLNPMVLLGCYWFVFGWVLDIGGSGDADYLYYLIAGIIPWVAISQSVTAGTSSLVANISVYQNIRCNLYIFPLASVASELSLLVAMIPAMVICFRLGGVDIPLVQSIVLATLCLLVTVVVLGGWLIFLSVINVFVRDIQYIVGTGLTLVFFSHPIVYRVDLAPPIYAEVIQWSPIFNIITAWRSAFGVDTFQAENIMILLVWCLIGWLCAAVSLARLGPFVREVS